MHELNQKILKEASHIGDGIIKVDSFINHQVYPGLALAIGKEFTRQFLDVGITRINKVLTAEVSGIAPAIAVAQVLDVPLVFARKHQPITMSEDHYRCETVSPTKRNTVELLVSSEFLGPEDRVLIIDDFLASARTVTALANIVKESGAHLLGIGCVIEKLYSKGREKLDFLSVPIVTLAKIDLKEGYIIIED